MIEVGQSKNKINEALDTALVSRSRRNELVKTGWLGHAVAMGNCHSQGVICYGLNCVFKTC